MISVFILAQSILTQQATRGQRWDPDDAAFAWPPRRPLWPLRLLSPCPDAAAAAAYFTVAAAAAVPCRRARGTRRRKPFEVEVAHTIHQFE
jgi:hypothetical protein